MSESILLTQEYERRPIIYRDMWNVGSWRLKVYDIPREGIQPSDDLVGFARAIASEAIANIPQGMQDHDIGFVGIRPGRDDHVVFVALWCYENELRHIAYRTNVTDAPAFLRVESGAPNLCVWDVELLRLERDAWLHHVLENPEGPNLTAYLETKADAKV